MNRPERAVEHWQERTVENWNGSKTKSIHPFAAYTVRAKCELVARLRHTRQANQLSNVFLFNDYTYVCFFFRFFGTTFIWIPSHIKMWCGVSLFVICRCIHAKIKTGTKLKRQLNFANWPMKFCDKCIHATHKNQHEIHKLLFFLCDEQSEKQKNKPNCLIFLYYRLSSQCNVLGRHDTVLLV